MERFALLFVACALSGIAIPMPEDVALLAAGSTVRTPEGFVGLAIAGTLGLLCRDGAFFALGFFVGEGVFRWKLVQRWLGESRIVKGRALVEANGGRAVLLCRFMIGVRATGFLVAGALGVRPRDFLFWDTIGLLVTVPLMLVLGLLLAEPIGLALDWLLANKLVVIAAVVAAAGVWSGVQLWRSR